MSKSLKNFSVNEVKAVNKIEMSHENERSFEKLYKIEIRCLDHSRRNIEVLTSVERCNFHFSEHHVAQVIKNHDEFRTFHNKLIAVQSFSSTPQILKDSPTVGDVELFLEHVFSQRTNEVIFKSILEFLNILEGTTQAQHAYSSKFCFKVCYITSFIITIIYVCHCRFLKLVLRRRSVKEIILTLNEQSQRMLTTPLTRSSSKQNQIAVL